MAQHVHDSAIIERRLRPIYDALEVGNCKKAVQESDKFLKKNPSITCARGLKALALVRMGKVDEAQILITQIAAETPCDDPTLQVMTFCYKELDQLDKICALYSNATKQAPGNEDLLSQLFMAYVRVRDYQSQQTVALQMYKLRPKNPYYFWAVMSVVLKAVRGPDSKDSNKSKLLLALAQRMIDKLIEESKLDAEQEVQLYLTILQYQNKHTEALEFLESDLGRTLYPGAPIQMKMDMLKAVKKWPTLNVLLKQLLVDNQDRWDYYKDYITTVLELQKTETSDVAECCFLHCNDFLNELIASSKKKMRGPYLGRLELHRVMTENGHDATKLVGDMLELLVDYFRLFGDKPCCANDILLFFNCLEWQRRPALASRLLQVCEISSTTLPQSKEQMQKHICSLQISRICGAHSLTAEHLAALYTAFSLHYEHGLSAFGIDTLPTDMGPSDSYALLAAHVMYDLALKLNSSEPLIEALCLLNYLLSNSPNNFHAKLLCLQIYHMLGCGWAAHRTYESLDIKHVQLDSLGYLHCAHLPIVGIASISKPLYDQTLKFFTTSYKESLEYLTMCYKFGSFSKLEEFMDFREKLSNSLHFLMVSAEAIIAEMVCVAGSHAQNIATVNGINIKPNEDRIQWTELTDNRDLSVLVRWDPKTIDNCNNANDAIGAAPAAAGAAAAAAAAIDQQQHEQTKMIADSFTQDTELLKIRSILLRLIAASIEAFTKESDCADAIDTLTMLNDKWNAEFKRIREQNYAPTSNRFLVNLLPSRLHSILLLPYQDCFTKLAQLIILLQQQQQSSETIENASKSFSECVTDVVRALDLTIKQHNEFVDLLWTRRNVQEIIVNCIEILSLMALVLSIGYDKYLKLSLNKQNKKVKKKYNQNGSNGEIPTLSDRDKMQTIQMLGIQLKLDLQQCEEALDSWKTPGVSDNITDRIAAMSLNPNVEVLVKTQLKEGHNLTVKELKIILKEKIRMLNGMMQSSTATASTKDAASTKPST